MVFNIICVLFVLVITFLHSLFGLYSGVLNAFCSVTALTVAFGFFEPLSRLVVGTGYVSSSYMPGIMLVALFLVTLIVLRVLADNYLRGNMRVPMYMDWVGGALFGFVNAQIMVGVMATGFLMLPWGDSVMGFSRYERDSQNETDPNTGRVVFHRNNLWFRSDDMATGLFSLISGGSMKAGTSFASVYPDFPEWVGWSGNQVQSESQTAPDKLDGYDSGLSVEAWWVQKGGLPADETRYRAVLPTKEKDRPAYEPLAYKFQEPGNHLLGMRLVLKNSSSDHDKDFFVHRFRPSVIRLVGDVIQPDGSRAPKQCAAQVIGGVDTNLGSNYRIVDLDNNFSVAGAGSDKLDVFFEVPEKFEPRFVEYRRYARAPVTNKKDNPPDERLSRGGGTADAGGGKDKSTGVGRFIDTVVAAGTGDIDKLPFAMAKSKLTSDINVTLKDGALASVTVKNRIAGEKKTYAGAAGDSVEKLKRPEGMRIFQLQTKTKKMESLAGKALNFVAATVNQYRAVDKDGKDYPLAGYYALVKKGGQDYFEFFFTPDPVDSGFDGMIDVSTDTRKALREQDDAILGLIFIVPPGKCIVSVQSQGGKTEFGKEYCMGK